VQSIAARSDLNYIFQEMPQRIFRLDICAVQAEQFQRRSGVPGGSAWRADYTIENGRYLPGQKFSPEAAGTREEKAPLAEPGLNVHAADCILTIGGEEVKGRRRYSKRAAGRARQVMRSTLHIASANGKQRTRHNGDPDPQRGGAAQQASGSKTIKRRVDKLLSGGKLAYVYSAGHRQRWIYELQSLLLLPVETNRAL